MITVESLLSEPAMVIVAHPDDEAIGLGVFLQLSNEAKILFLTSGEGCSIDVEASTTGHAGLMREREAIAVANALPNAKVLGFERLPDKSLWNCLPKAALAIERALRRHCVSQIITHAYEGGHPDHDCCSFLVNRIGKRFGIVDIIEFPLYSNRCFGLVQEFAERGESVALHPSDQQQRRKRTMFELHASQQSVLRRFRVDCAEVFRGQPDYEYAVPAWEDYYVDVRVEDVVAAFDEFDRSMASFESCLA